MRETSPTKRREIQSSDPLLQYLSSASLRTFAPLGVLRSPIRISRLFSLLPYSAAFSSWSGRRVAPFRATPAKSPLLRDQARISADILTSVLAFAVLPTGP